MNFEQIHTLSIRRSKLCRDLGKAGCRWRKQHVGKVEAGAAWHPEDRTGGVAREAKQEERSEVPRS